MRKLTAIFLLIAVLVSVSISSATLTQAQGAPAWQPNTAYAINALVTYNGSTYKCIQAHTSQVGWEPPNVPALWALQSGSGSTATNTVSRPPTNTPIPAGTNTPVPTTSGSCTDPAYVQGTVYTGGMKVSYNGHSWTAKWWTQNEYPSTGGSGVWQDNGPCSAVTSTFVPPTATNTHVGPTATFTSTSPASSGLRIMGYYADWDVYGRAFFPKGMVTSGLASKVNYIIFAFGNITNGNCAIGDAYADSQMNYSAANSVSGVADPTDGSITTGIIHQFQEMKALNPNLKIIWSFGGWTWSGGFGAAAANATAFANSCYNLVHNPAWNGTFAGIDLDWEYPNSCGLNCDTSGFGSYKTLMAAMRSRFGSDIVTAAITADGTSGGKMDAADYGGAAQYLDWYNLMTYDYFGAFTPSGPTAPHSPLYSYSGIPSAGFYADAAVQKLKSKGVPSNKIQLGIGFYGRGWTGVTQLAPGGSASGAASGTYEAGIDDYHVLVNTCPATSTIAGTAYGLCGNNWWSYDTPSTIAGKMSYAKSQGLGGAFFWEAFGDTTNGTLISAMYNNR